ncbi:MAG: ATP-binding protein [Sedimentisphaerales bacterium]|jgi:two-component system phosphate regulon sensor histidine kinase PhoR
MARKRLIWQLYFTYLLVIVAALTATTWYFSASFRQFYIDQTADKLSTLAKVYSTQITPLVQESKNNEIDTLCKKFGKLSAVRITIISTSGAVLGDSEQYPAKMENHSDRPEFIQAIQKSFGRSSRLSHTLEKKMMYVALPIVSSGKTIAVIRTAISIDMIDDTLHYIYIKIVSAAILVSVIVAFLSGAILILNDVTRFRRLENIRKDFVANVSHELKTPITSIKGFVETLLEGGVKDPQQVNQFLEVIAKHTERLNAIVEDLLSLSRLEESRSKRDFVLKKVYLKSILSAAIELSGIKAHQKRITINLNCLDDLKVNANTLLLEQAVFNLIDNAIKYSEPDNIIKITAQESEKELLISVQDNGCGIEQKHLPRLFERFYVVDKSRSRKLGGTGLGLSIVKHIVQLHNGSVSVESTPSKGSTFTIHLPIV